MPLYPPAGGGAHTMASHSDNTFDGSLTPNAGGTLDVGLTGTRFRDLFLSGTAYAHTGVETRVVYGQTGAPLDLYSWTSQKLRLGVNAALYWEMNLSGHIVPINDSSYNIGSDTVRPYAVYTDELYVRNHLELTQEIGIPYLQFQYADSGPSLVDDNDVFGRLHWAGYDGGAYLYGAQIFARADGTPTTNQMPTELVFSTNDGSMSPSERWRISPVGVLEPVTDATYDIGSATVRPATLYVDTIRASGGGSYFENSSIALTLFIGKTTGVATGDTVARLSFRGNGQEVAQIEGRAALNAPAVGDAPGAIYFLTSANNSSVPLARWLIDEVGALLPYADSTYNIGSDTVRPLYIYADQVEAPNLVAASAETATPPQLTFIYADTGPALVDDNDVLAYILSRGYDGAAYVDTAAITARIDGTTGGSGDLPTELVFSTHPDGTSGMAERWRIAPAGHLEPMADSTYNIGSDTVRPAVIYVDQLNASSNVYVNNPSASAILYLASAGVVQDEEIGKVDFRANSYLAAAIRAIARVGTPGSTDAPADIVFATSADNSSSPTDRWAITYQGHLLPSTTSAVNIGSSSATVQDIYAETIRFPGTQVASSGVNDFDDYEEGTWTPAITFGTPGNLAQTVVTQEGYYRKVGSEVTIWWEIYCSAFTHTTASGYLQLTGLPFTPSSGNKRAGGVVIHGYSLTTLKWVVPRNNSGEAFLQFDYSIDNGASGRLTTAHMPTGAAKGLYGQYTYTV